MQEKSDTPSVKGKNYADFSRDELIAEINRLKKTKKYGLVWEHKKEEVIENFKAGQQPYLKEVEDKRIENAPGEPTNLIIEGDNFDALSVLNYTHAGKIDVIYIDPPYNTGNKDFIYNDNYVDSEDAFRHSKWLSFMEPRLKLAKNLLAEDGVIFISIDEHEQSALKLLCDKVFGDENFVDCVVWDKKSSAKGVPPRNMLVNVHEYIVTYQKSSKFSFLGEKRDEGSFKNPDNDPRGPWRNTNIKSTIKSKDKAFTIVDPKTGNEYTDTWAYSKAELDRLIEDGVLLFPKNKNGQVRRKEYLLEMKNQNMAIKSSFGLFDGQKNTEMLKSMLPGILFLNPKPIALMEYLLGIASDKNATILDFFAGSGTTGHAVLELNKEDGGHRQFILCTNNGDKGPDSTKIAEEITYPRIKTVITGKRQDGSKYSDGIPANLRYYKIKHEQKLGSNDANRQNMSKHIEDILQIKENAFEEVKTGRAYKLYKNSEKYLCLALDAFEMEKIIEKIAEENREKLDTIIYSFSYSRDAFEDDYETDFNIEFKAMPEGLLKTYLNITESLRSED